MKIRQIYIDEKFEKEFSRLPRSLQQRAEKARRLLMENAFHPSLRLHKLSGAMDGLWSISINRQYCILFEPLKNGDVVLVSIGTHAIYDY